VYEAGGTESISTYSKVFLEHEFIEIGDRRREFVNSVKDHVDFLKANLQANRALDGGGSQTASWSDTLTANAQQLEAGPRLFATNDHMAVLLLGADVLDRGKIRWDNLAMDKYRTERLGPNDSATDMPARDAWPAFYPAEIPSDELPDNHDQIYQQWTERRAKVAPRDRLTLLGTLPASRIEYASGSGELEATLDEVNWRWTLSWPSEVQTAIDERGINRDNVWVAPIRNHMFGINAAAFVFSRPKQSYQFHADGLTSGRPFIDVEIDLEIGEIEQQRDEYSHVILIHAKPVRVEVLNKGESLWQGSVTEVSEGN
jgi:hypothetical protein